VAIPVEAYQEMPLSPEQIAGNYDATQFSEPDRLDLERQNASGHLGFGYGIHYCIGASLAKAELRLVIRRINIALSLPVLSSRTASHTYFKLHVVCLSRNNFGNRLGNRSFKFTMLPTMCVRVKPCPLLQEQ
jgi:hypothetical protein